MFEQTITPRFVETDALRHINNTVYPQWFEVCREPIFKIFTPDLDVKKWALTLAHISCDFHKEVFFGTDVVVKTAVSKIGNSSFHLSQAVYQHNQLCTTGKTVSIHFNHAEKKSMPIPDGIREQLEQHMLEGGWPETL